MHHLAPNAISSSSLCCNIFFLKWKSWLNILCKPMFQCINLFPKPQMISICKFLTSHTCSPPFYKNCPNKLHFQKFNYDKICYIRSKNLHISYHSCLLLFVDIFQKTLTIIWNKNNIILYHWFYVFGCYLKWFLFFQHPLFLLEPIDKVSFTNSTKYVNRWE